MSEKINEPKLSLACPYCKSSLFQGENIRCSICGTGHHKSCWKQHGRCSVFNCPGKRTDRQVVSSKDIFAIVSGVIAVLSLTFIISERFSKKEVSETKAVVIQSEPKQVVMQQPPQKVAPDQPRAIPAAPKPPMPPVEQIETDATTADSWGKMVDPAEIISPLPGDKWFIGQTYTISWKNTVPPNTHDYEKFGWSIHLYRPNGLHWDFRHIPIYESSHDVTINDVYQTASDYYIQIVVECNVGILSCGTPGGTYYETAGPIKIISSDNQ